MAESRAGQGSEKANHDASVAAFADVMEKLRDPKRAASTEMFDNLRAVNELGQSLAVETLRQKIYWQRKALIGFGLATLMAFVATLLALALVFHQAVC